MPQFNGLFVLKLTHPWFQLSTTEVAKMVSQAWKDLSSEEREKWEEMARKDKARYEMEKSMYTGPWKVPAKKRSQKDPNAPKRPMSAFLSFSNSKRSYVKDKHPDIGNAEVSRNICTNDFQTRFRRRIQELRPYVPVWTSKQNISPIYYLLIY